MVLILGVWGLNIRVCGFDNRGLGFRVGSFGFWVLGWGMRLASKPKVVSKNGRKSFEPNFGIEQQEQVPLSTD